MQVPHNNSNKMFDGKTINKKKERKMILEEFPHKKNIQLIICTV